MVNCNFKRGSHPCPGGRIGGNSKNQKSGPNPSIFLHGSETAIPNAIFDCANGDRTPDHLRRMGCLPVIPGSLVGAIVKSGVCELIKRRPAGVELEYV